MPAYDYKCKSCGTVTPINHSINTDPELHCPKCGKRMTRSIYVPAVTFKGTGWGKDR